MATDVQQAAETLEQVAPDFIAVLWKIVNEGDFVPHEPEYRYTDQEVDEIDLLYCRVQTACDVMRIALCARRRQTLTAGVE
ncbi:MAG: hypothetical protein V2A73_12480 [Pseudomonadota bacterium]